MLNNVSISNIAEAVGCSEKYFKNIAKILSLKPDNDGCFNGEKVYEFIKQSYENLPTWVVQRKDDRIKRQRKRLKTFKAVCLYLIEESNYLMSLNDDERQRYREEYSDMLCVVDDFLQAEKLLEPDYAPTPEAFVEKVMTKMQKTGYIYKVGDVFRKMIALFRIVPELMNDKMPQLMDIILQRDVTAWKENNLRTQLLSIINYYIDTNRSTVDTFADFENKKEQELLATLIKAIAAQLFLYSDEDNIDYALNRSMLYRYASHAKIAKESIDTLQNKSYACLIGAIDSTLRLEYSWEQIRSTDMLISVLMSDRVAQKNCENIEYSSPAANILFTNNSIEIREKSNSSMQPKVVAPGIVPWHGMKFLLQSDPDVKVNSNTADVEKLRGWWKEVERTLTSTALKLPKRAAKRRACPGDKVDIVLDGVEDNDHFRCHIISKGIEGSGIISVAEMVTYKIRPEAMLDISRMAFFSKEGNPLIFEATVMTDNGSRMSFSIKKYLYKFLTEECDYLSYGYETTGVITAILPYQNICVGVSEDGFPIAVPYDAEMKLGDNYRVMVTEVKEHKQSVQLYCEIIEKSMTTVTQDKAIVELMQQYGLDEPIEEDKQKATSLRQLPAEHLCELIRLLDRESLRQMDVHRRYNILSTAKLLSHISGNEEMVTYYENRLALQKFLYDFSKNNSIDREKLKQLKELNEETKAQYPVLQLRLKELHMLLCLGSVDRNTELFNSLHTETNKELISLINLVLAYNHLSNFDMQEQQKSIIEQINKLLDVKLEIQQSHFFGEETDQQEFKSSVVYVANSEHQYIPDIAAQKQVILKEVCSFLNTKGGTLYIGVNDYGYAQGLDLDMEWFRQHKIWNVNNIDGYRQYVVNMLCREWRDLKDVFDVTFPNIEGKQVVAVKVPPCKEPVSLDGKYYCRVGSECRLITEEGLKGFLERRPMQYEQLIHNA